MIEQRREIVGRVVVRERFDRLARRSSVSAFVPADATPARAQRRDLRREHFMIHQQTMREHDGRGVAACVLEVELLAIDVCVRHLRLPRRSEEHTSELQSLMRISYAVFCLKKKKI